MKEIIRVDIKTKKIDFAKYKTGLLCVGLFSDVKGLTGAAKEIDIRLKGKISRMLKLGDFKGKEAGSCVIYSEGLIAAERVLLVGLGEKKKAKIDTFRKAAAVAADAGVRLKAKSIMLALHQQADSLDMEKVGQAITEGVCLGSYRYDEFVTGDKNGRLKSLEVVIADNKTALLKNLSKGVLAGEIIGRAQNFAQTIANRPANVITPASLAEIAKKAAKEVKGLSCTVFDQKQLTAKKMGGILAVGSGSKNTPRLIVLKYQPKVKAGDKLATVALVGKAITFDSGGISIKPSAGMEEMKFDKSGGIAVIAAMKAIAKLGAKVRVFGLIPSAENMPSGSSYRPGDIVTTFSGKTVEVQNTDAEGRMILCDALWYAVKQGCEKIVDIATLTGACVVALGKFKAGLMGNDDKLIEQLKKASEASGEAVWELPCGEEYLEEMKSKIADLKNSGGRWGGACTAAAFLSEFVDDKKWAHIDMAGVDMFENDKRPGGSGASGFGVRLLTEFVINCGRK